MEWLLQGNFQPCIIEAIWSYEFSWKILFCHFTGVWNAKKRKDEQNFYHSNIVFFIDAKFDPLVNNEASIQHSCVFINAEMSHASSKSVDAWLWCIRSFLNRPSGRKWTGDASFKFLHPFCVDSLVEKKLSTLVFHFILMISNSWSTLTSTRKQKTSVDQIGTLYFSSG